MIDIDNLFIDYNRTLKEQINNVEKNIDSAISFVEFNSSNLLEYNDHAPELTCNVWRELWSKFKDTPSPVIYWFEIISDHSSQEVYDLIKSSKENLPSRNFPSIRTNAKNPVSKILYVGSCVKTPFHARLFWHTGYYKVGGTQGLQLCHWTKKLIDFKLKISVIALPYEAQDLTILYEQKMAKEMMPIIGMH